MSTIKQPRTLPSGVRLSGNGKQFLAYLIDFSLTIATLFLLYVFIGGKVIVPAMGYDSVLADEQSLIEASGIAGSKDDGYPLYTYDSAYDGNSNPVYEKYEGIVWNYYTVFIATDSRAEFLESDGYVEGTNPATWVLSHIYHIESGKEIDTSIQPYYTAYEEGGVKDYTHAPVLNEAYQAAMNETNSELTRDQAALNLKNYYSTVTSTSSSDASGVYIDCVYHFQKQSAYLSAVNKITNIRYMAFLPGVIASPLIFFFIIPMCVPHGRTVGKLICRLAVLNQEGYEAKKWQFAARYAILTAFWFFLLLPSTLLGIAIAMACLMVDYMVLATSRNHQALHDLAGRTIVIDAKNSTWFKNAEEAAAQETIQDPETDPAIERKETIEPLDLGTVEAAHRETASIQSFDEYEKEKSDKE